MAKKANPAGEVNRKLKTTPIAVIGLASILPQAHNLDEYWDNILNKINCISDIPASRWSIEDYYDPDPKVPDKSYCKRGGFIPDIDFDPMEFGLPPNILEVTDVSQLLALVVAKEALEDAGYGDERNWDRELTGAILGVVGMSSKLVQPLLARLQYPVWEKVLRSAGVPADDVLRVIEKFKAAYVGWEENAFPGTIVNVIAGRICNRFDLGGTNCVIDAACASSLAAVRMAVMELTEGRADMMITGGVDVDNSILTYMCFSKTPAFSKGEVVKAFDADSDGMMVGEGIGMLVLKRLEDAERDGDRVYAVIRGMGASSDGRFKSIYAPRSEGQAKAMRRAYEDAGFAAATVGLVEAHGTGTMAGDPAEFNGINMVFSENNPKRQYIALGSVKSQIAHTKSTAGAASLIKVALALHNKVLPATLNVSNPNPKLDIENTPFYLNSETRPWIRPDGAPPRRGAVSSFGFGGTNYHVVLEEYRAEHNEAYRRSRVAQMIVLDAQTQAMLVAKGRDTLAELKGERGEVIFHQLGQAGQEHRIPLNHARVGFLADTRADAAALLQTAIEVMQNKAQEEAWESPKGIFYRKAGLDPQGKVVALFPGQGAQYVEMGKELALNFPTVRQTFARMDGLFLEAGEEPLSGTIFPIPVFTSQGREAQNEQLTRTQNAQPAIGVLSAAIYQLLRQGGFAPDFAAGHSFGELTALWAAGVVSETDYYTLAKARGKAMAPPADPNFDAGSMLAVKGDVEQIRRDIADMAGVTLANWNSKNQVVLAGPKADMAQAQQALTEKGYSAIALSVSAAFHTPLVGHAQKPFAEAIAATVFHQPKIKVFSNSTGKQHAGQPQAIQQLLAEHILNPVLWKDEIEAIYAAGGYFFVECGPKNVLTNLVDNILADKPHVAVAMNASPKKDSDRQLREAAVKLKVAGLDLGKIDPFQMRSVKAPKKRSPVTVKLNGGLHVSEKTRQGFENALKDGFKLVKPQPMLSAVPAAPVIVRTIEIAQPNASRPVEGVAAPAPVPAAVLPVAPAPAVMNAVEQALIRLQTQQSEASHVHEQYLANDAEYGKIFSQVTQMGVGLVSNPNANSQQIEQALAALQSVERSMMRFHDHQTDTLRVHEQYLKTQEDFAARFVGLVQAQFDALPSTGRETPGVRRSSEALRGSPAAAPATAPRPAVAVVQAQPVVTQKPKEEVRMVEKLVTVAPIPLVAAPKNGNGSHTALPAVVSSSAPLMAPVAVGVNADDLARAVLGVVSEKTGYPPEMLDINMDMEADLGIDSIKRVEIVGAVREMYPQLPKMDADTFGELHSLAQIIDFMNQTLGSATAPAPAVVVAPAVVAVPLNPESTGGVSSEAVKLALLGVVSEKTGYPQEMLDLDMDMEADLGIDSIKRVEILGAMRAIYADLPKVEPEFFAEMRTLSQVIEHIYSVLPSTGREALPGTGTSLASVQALAQSAAPILAAVPAVVTELVTPFLPTSAAPVEASADLTQALLSVVSEKTGYPTEMLELGMDMEADLGIDSIKKVEIMGAMRLALPHLPKADPESFAEARTLGQVVAYLGTLAAEATTVPF